MKRINMLLHKSALALAVMSLAACTTPRAPDLAAARAPAAWPTLATAPAEAGSSPDATRQAWWRGLQDPQLVALQEQAARANADIGQAALRWQRALLQAGQGALALGVQPSLSLSSAVDRPLQSQPGPTDITRSFGLSANASYELDLWSRLAEGQRAELVQADSARVDIEVARWLASTQVAERYWSLAAADAQLPLAREQLANAREALVLTRLRADEGKLLPLEVDKASSAVQDAAVRLANLEGERQLHRQALALLTGEALPSAALAQARLPEQALPEWRLGPPESVLEQRPDVRKARLAVDAALHRSRAAEAERYPRLSFNAGVSTGGSAWRDWLSQPLGTLAAGLAIPLVDWRRLDLNRDLARTDLELAALALRDGLQRALADVEAQFTERVKLQRALDASQAHRAEAQRAERAAKLRYELGSIGRLDWLQARNASLAAEQDLQGLTLRGWINVLAVHKALGGPV